MRRLPSRAASTRLENGCDSLMITDVDCDCICRFANPKSVHARSCLIRFCSLRPLANYLRLQVPGPYCPAAKAWVQRAYPRSTTRSSDGVGSV